MKKLEALKKYMLERESIRLKRLAGKPWPWTTDKILQTYKFTNVKREHDKTTKAFVEHYRHHYSRTAEHLLLYNCGVARYFGTDAFKLNVGWLMHHDKSLLIGTASRMQRQGLKVFTGAYIVTSGGVSGPKEKLVTKYLGGLWLKSQTIVAVMAEEGTWQAGYEVMRTLPGFGGSGFMTKEVLQDFLLVSKLRITDRDTWTPMGPGGRRGMNRLLGRDLGFRQPEEEFIKEVQAVHAELRKWWLHHSPGELTAHDVQFNLCEFDKYERVRLGQGRPRALYRGGVQ